jgi:hypothetical protein
MHKQQYHNSRNLKCKKCGNNRFYREKRNLHLGIYCYKCNSFLKWDRQEKDCKNCNFYYKKSKSQKTCNFDIKKDSIKNIKVKCDTFQLLKR